MRKRGLAVVLGVIGLVVAAPAFAQDDDELDRLRSGVYFSARGLYAIDHFDLEGRNRFSKGREFASVGVGDSSGIDARLGYRINSILAAELQLEWTKQFDVKQQRELLYGFVQFRGTAFAEGIAPFVNGKAYAPLGGAFQPYAAIGVGGLFMNTKGPFSQSITENGPAVRAAVGMDLYGFGSDSFAITLEGGYTVGLADAQRYRYVATSAGFTWRW